MPKVTRIKKGKSRGAVLVRLSKSEITHAASVGVERQAQNIRDKRRSAHGHGGDNDWQVHIEGALSECAFAAYQGVYWWKGQLRDDDVGRFQVRSTQHEYGHLLLHDTDQASKIFWLVTGKNGDYIIQGYILAGDGQDEDKYWRCPPGTTRACYMVPIADLKRPPIGGMVLVVGRVGDEVFKKRKCLDKFCLHECKHTDPA